MSGENSPSHSTMPPTHVARECWDIFMYEINGTGIAYQFEHGPRDFDVVTNYTIPAHLKDRAALQRSIDGFGRYKELLKSFSPFPLTQTMPDYSRDGAPDRVVTREVSPELLDSYDTFGRALDYYATVIDDRIAGNADDDEVVAAAIGICKIARPGMWNPDVEEGSEAYYASPIRDTNPRWYLEVAMANPQQ